MNTDFASGSFWLSTSLMCPLSTARWAASLIQKIKVMFRQRVSQCSDNCLLIHHQHLFLSQTSYMSWFCDFGKAYIPLSLCWSDAAMEIGGLGSPALLGAEGARGKDVRGFGALFYFAYEFSSAVFQGPHCQDSRQSSYKTAFTKSFIMHLGLRHSNWNTFQVDCRAPAQNFFQVKHRDVCDTRENSEESQATDMCAVQPLGLDGTRNSCRGTESKWWWSRAGALLVHKDQETESRPNISLHVCNFARERMRRKNRVWEERLQESEDGYKLTSGATNRSIYMLWRWRIEGKKNRHIAEECRISKRVRWRKRS